MKIKVFLLLIAMFISPVFADDFVPMASFYDVPNEHWAFEYVESLLSDKVIDQVNDFRPNDSLQRDEFIKMVMLASKAATDNKPETPTFTDVSRHAWSYKYIESALKQGIVNGYKDASGNYTGQFGPADIINRAAAAKILVKAFKVPITLNPRSSFSDVRRGDWFYGSVVTVYNQSIADGYSNGKFGPADPLTRAQAAKLIIQAQNPVERETIWQIPSNTEEKTAQPLDPVPDATVPYTSPIIQEPSSTVPVVVIEDVTPEPMETFHFTDTDSEASIVLAGKKGKFMGGYRFHGELEDFNINKLTIVNDLIGDNMGDNITTTTTIKEVFISYPDIDGNIRFAHAPLSGGSITFSNLAFYVPKHSDTFLSIYADINPMSAIGSVLSGQKFRLGVQNTGNTVSTFEAVGLITSDTTYMSDSQLSGGFLGGVIPSEFVVRKASPIFEVIPGDTQLSLGNKNLIQFRVTSSENTSFSFGRIVFTISASSGLQLSDFQLLRGASVLSDQKINLFQGGIDVSVEGGGNITNLSKLILSFNQEEIISGSNVYTLRAQVSGSASGGHIDTRIAIEDDNLERSPNTDQLIGGIFPAESNFKQMVGSDDHIIWSDRSADNHQYTLNNGGSADWINGYLLKINGLLSQTLTD